MSTDIVMLDANIAMYAAGKSHSYKQSCVWVMTEVVQGCMKAAIDTEIVQEILYRYSVAQQWNTAVEMATNLLGIVPTVYPVQPADIALCVELCKQYGPRGLSPRDLLHVAVMRNNGLDTIISTDTDFDRVDGIIRLDPRALYAKAHP
jgi:uncharacterized protein